jgi:hypothetical protein
MCQTEVRVYIYILYERNSTSSGIGVSDSDVEFRSRDCHKIAAEYLPCRRASAETCLGKWVAYLCDPLDSGLDRQVHSLWYAGMTLERVNMARGCFHYFHCFRVNKSRTPSCYT